MEVGSPEEREGGPAAEINEEDSWVGEFVEEDDEDDGRFEATNSSNSSNEKSSLILLDK